MKKNVEKELLKIIRTMADMGNKTDAELLKVGYLDEGFIDSFQLVEMIAKLENNFSIKFSAAELISSEFRTLAGLSAIIERNLSGSKK